MKILVTGMSGFIATNFFQYLNREHPDTDVYGFDLAYGQDLRNFKQVREAVEGKDVVFHFGALTHIDSSIKDPHPFLETNINGTYNLLCACTDLKIKMVQISSSEVYGTIRRVQGFEKQDEDHPLMGHSPYAFTKIAQDRMCYSWWQTYETNVRVVRLFNQYGPYQDIRKVIPKFIQQLENGQPLTIYGDGLSKRDWVFVQDTVEAIWLSQKLLAGDVCNVCTGKNYTVLDLIHLLEEITKKSGQIVKVAHTDERFGHVKELLGDPAYTIDALGWRYKTDLPEGLEKMYKWLKENGAIKYLGGDPKTIRYLVNEGTEKK